MNKELIKKYKPEFEHWLNDGDIVVGRPISENEWVYSTAEEPQWKDDNVVYIINDEYIELRKALAEGKIIQFNYHYATNNNPNCEWRKYRFPRKSLYLHYH